MPYLAHIRFCGCDHYQITVDKPAIGFLRETNSRVVSEPEKLEPNAMAFGLAEILRGRGIVVEDRSNLFCYGEGVSR